MPFVRLVLIYIVVIVAAILFFQRESLMGMLGLSFEDETPVAAAPTQPQANATSPEPVQSPIEQPSEMSSDTSNTSKDSATEVTEAGADRSQSQGIQTPVADPAPTAATNFVDRLEEARRAYWQGDFVGAETKYLGLVEDAPENADVLGELGNIYYAQRKYSAAADYYYKAALQLLEDGETPKVLSLVGVLQSIAPQKASALRARLNQ